MKSHIKQQVKLSQKRKRPEVLKENTNSMHRFHRHAFFSRMLLVNKIHHALRSNVLISREEKQDINTANKKNASRQGKIFTYTHPQRKFPDNDAYK